MGTPGNIFQYRGNGDENGSCDIIWVQRPDNRMLENPMGKKIGHGREDGVMFGFTVIVCYRLFCDT